MGYFSKRELRKYAVPKLPPIDRNSGLLTNSTIWYIVRSAVKIIDGKRLLCLYFYDRKEVCDGKETPAMTMFQHLSAKGGDFITLDNRNKKSRWRTAEIAEVVREEQTYFNSNLSANVCFYSMKDAIIASKYVKAKNLDDVLHSVRVVQLTIRSKQADKRREEKKEQIRRLFQKFSSLPKMEKWLNKKVFPGYLLCEHTAVKKEVKGRCSCCGATITSKGLKRGGTVTCPKCKKPLTVVSLAARMKEERTTVNVLSRFDNERILVRTVKVWRNISAETGVRLQQFETSRAIISPGKWECYWHSLYEDEWKKGLRPVMNPWYYNFYADDSAVLYPIGVKAALKGTAWEYLPVEQAKKVEPFDWGCFLAKYTNHRRAETLLKTGFTKLGVEIVLSYNDWGLDETQNRLHRILGVAPEEIEYLRSMNLGAEDLKNYKQLPQKSRPIVWDWVTKSEIKVVTDTAEVLKTVRIEKLKSYCEKQRGKFKKSSYRSEAAEFVATYRDYLDLVRKLNLRLSKSVLYPKDLIEAHDKAVSEVKMAEDAKIDEAIRTAASKWEKLEYATEQFAIMMPKALADVIHEGSELCNCVGENYPNRIRNGECLILFVRKASEPTKPYFCLEVRNKKVVQLRGYRNCDPPDDVKKFVAGWEKKTLARAS